MLKFIKHFITIENLFKLLILFNEACLYLFILWTLSPQFNHYLGIYRLIIILVFWIISAFVVNREKTDLHFYIKWTFLLIWFILIIIRAFAKPTPVSINVVFFPYFLFFFYAFILSYYIKNKQFQIIKRIAFVSLLIILYSSFVTIIGYHVYPNASRVLSTGLGNTLKYTLKGIVNFDFIYGVAFIIPTLFYLLFKRAFKNRIVNIIVLAYFVMMLYLVLKASFTLALILVSLGVILSIFKSKSTLNNFFYGLLLLLVFFAFKDYIGEYVMNKSMLINNPLYQKRIFGIGNWLVGNNLDPSGAARLNFMSMSMKSFLKSPFIGIGAYYGYEASNFGIGMHSEWSDLLGRYGIIINMWLIAFLIYNFINIYHTIQNQYFKRTYIITFQLFIYLGLVNQVLVNYSIGYFVFLLIPSIPYLFNNEIIKGEEISKGWNMGIIKKRLLNK